nr:immunoglobulin light chain junction region [Macaca mulatta]
DYYCSSYAGSDTVF